MDSITQAALGAAIGQAGFRHLGRRAALFGMFCGLFPDFDIVLGRGDPWQGLVTHRGSSHSLVVLPVVAIPLGLAAWKLLGKGEGSAKTWVHLAFWGLITHPLLDVCTTYGTQLLAPVSRSRFAIDCVAILDPLYTLPMLVAVLYGARKRSVDGRARRLAWGGLLWGLAYLSFGWCWSQWAEATFEDALAAEDFVPVAVRTPVPFFFNVLRHGAARDAEGRVAVTTIVPWSVGRTRGELRVLTSVDSPRAQAALASERGQLTRWFADDMLTVSEAEDGTLWFTDHRYGMFTDPTWTPFRASLPPEADPTDLRRRRRPGGEERQLDMGAELAKGWSLIVGG